MRAIHVRAAHAIIAISVVATTVSPATAHRRQAEPVKAPQPPAGLQAIVQQRAADVVGIFGGRSDYDGVFAPSFRSAVPKARFDAIVVEITGALGKPMGVESLTSTGPTTARVRIGFERGIVALDIGVDPAAPHQITSLLTRGVEPRAAAEASVDAVVATVATLPGRTNFTLAKLGDGAPTRIAARESATPLAIGSAFKLVILSELVRSIAAGERRWTDSVTIDGRPLPGGAYTLRAKGVQVPVRELAERMISVSDNSATDILLHHLGREKVEAMLPVVGMTDGGARNMPFLGTLEVFKLKGIDGGALGARYLALPPAARRAFLDRDVAAAPVSALPADLFKDGKPIRIDQLEWFASADDLVRTMDWLRRHSEGAGGTELRAILSKNAGLPAPAAAAWRFVGYKGGSEPGVLNLTYLLQGKDGAWYALSSGWNDPAAEVDTLRFSGLIARAAELAAPR